MPSILSSAYPDKYHSPQASQTRAGALGESEMAAYQQKTVDKYTWRVLLS